MPPRQFSRYTFATTSPNAKGELTLYGADPYTYRAFPDNVEHVVRDGDTLWTLAAFYYAGSIYRPAGLWWVIADFQPSRIHDPTLALVVGTVLVIPSLRTVIEEVFSEKRRAEE